MLVLVDENKMISTTGHAMAYNEAVASFSYIYID
jgi:hypothetical protein